MSTYSEFTDGADGAELERLKAERDDLFRERDAWMELLYQFARRSAVKLAAAKRDRDFADGEAEQLREENDSLRARLDELEAELQAVRS